MADIMKVRFPIFTRSSSFRFGVGESVLSFSKL